MTIARFVCGLALLATLGGCFDGSSHDSDPDTPSQTPTDPPDGPPDTSTPAQCTTMHCAPAP